MLEKICIKSIDKSMHCVYTVYRVNTQYKQEEAENLNIIISNVNSEPIYEQIYKQIKGEIISGALSEGEMLPSIRSLAKDLRISVITTKRAYEELERDGYINTVQGKGCYVAAKNIELIREENLKEIEKHMSEIASLASTCSLTYSDLTDMLKTILEENI